MPLVRLAVVCAAVLAAVPAAAAEDFPSRAVTIVSPYQPGGTNDIIARILAQKLAERWGQNVIIENKPGANGSIGVVAVTRSVPDGHTLLAVPSSALTINPIFYSQRLYDVDRDLAPLTRTGAVPNVLVVNPAVPADSVAALIALARSKPRGLIYASQGVGSNGHMTGELFKGRAGIEMLHVPYKGSAPAVQDLLAGQVQVMFDNLPTVLPLIRTGRLRALGVGTAVRSPQLPDVPSIAESGLPGFDTSAWFALLAPRAVDPSRLREIEAAAIAVLTADDTRTRLSAAGIEVTADGAEELTGRIAREGKMWRAVVAQAGIKVE